MAAYPRNQVGLVAREVLKLTVPQAIALHDNGWDDLTDFEGYSTSDIKAWMSSNSRLTVARGGVVFPSTKAKRIYALAYWVNRKILRGVPIDPDDFTMEILTSSMADYPIHDMKLDEDDDVDKPEQFKYEAWNDWQDSVVTFLKGKKSIRKDIPLYYVIRETPNPIPLVDMTEEDEIIYNAPHNGAAFKLDNRSVHTYLTELTNGTDADQWIKQHKRTQDGRLAWKQLCDHYDGPAEGDKRITVARSDIKILHYKNEASFSFEQYSTKLRKAFLTLKQYKQPKHEKEMVDILLDQINTSDNRLISTIAICRDSHSSAFDDACTYMSQQIAILYPQHQPNAFGKTGRGGRRPRPRQISGVKKRNGKTYFNGVDISDTTRYFSSKEDKKVHFKSKKHKRMLKQNRNLKDKHRRTRSFDNLKSRFLKTRF